MYDRLTKPSFIYRYHWNPTGHTLERDDTEVFFLRKSYACYRRSDYACHLHISRLIVEKYIIASYCHLHESFEIRIIGTIEDDEIFLWHMLEGMDDLIDRLRWGQSSKRYIIIGHFSFYDAFHIIVLLYGKWYLLSHRTKSEHIHRRIDDLYICSLGPCGEPFLIFDRIRRYDVHLRELIEIEIFSYEECYHIELMEEK